MVFTPHLGLPLIAAAQAQKHVTHNEALSALDALVHLAVFDRDLSTPPAAPAEGDRYIVATGAVGAWAGKDGQLAFWRDGLWRFHRPDRGWVAYVLDEGALLAWNGAAWTDALRTIAEFQGLSRLGLGTTADAANPFSVKLNDALWTARAAAEGGTGDLRAKFNKEGPAKVASLLFQSGWSGRAEFGLLGGDDFCIKVSADGAAWSDALRIDRATGFVVFPRGAAGAAASGNLLVNADFLVNQRGFPGGALAAGAYGFDRWRAGPGGCTLARAASGPVTLSGPLEQVVELAQWQSATAQSSFADMTLTLSVEDPSAPIPVTVGAQSAVIEAGPGRRGVSLTLGSGETGNILLRLNPASSCTFRRPKLEVGAVATPWSGAPLDTEQQRCRRYYQLLASGGGPPAVLGVMGQRVAATVIDIPYVLPVPMRASPALATSGFAWANGTPVNNQVAFFDNAGAAWVALSGALMTTTAVVPGASAVVDRFQAGTGFSGASGAIGNLYLGAAAFIAFSAEL